MEEEKPEKSTQQTEERELELICRETDLVEGLPARLTTKMRRFADEYVMDYRPREAAIRAGYSINNASDTAYTLLKHPEISKYIDKVEALAIDRNIVTKSYFISKCKHIIESPSARFTDQIQALTLLAKLTGHLKEKSFESKQVVVLQQQGLQPMSTKAVEYIIEKENEG